LTQSIYKIALGLAGLLLLGSLGLILAGNIEAAGPVLVGFFLALAFGFRGYDSLKGFVYTTVIFAAVTLALYYPQYFLTVGDFKLTGLITPLIQIIMFGMGTSMSAKDFVAVVKTPKGVVIGVTAQFLIMPSMGFLLATVTNFPPEVAAGIVLIGCSPSGLASNVMSYLAKANLALSITITSIATLMAPVVTPALMKLLAGQFIEIDMLDMMWDIAKMIIIPIGLGLIVNKLMTGRTKFLNEVMPIVSMAGIALIIVVITAAGRDSLLDIGAVLLVVVLVHNLFGYTLGYWFARVFSMPERDCRTVAIEVGMQNGGLASAIANSLGKIGTMGLAAGIFGPLMNISGSMLASYWHKRPPAGYVEPETEEVVRSH
jgi:BASS family bile acid:Na+ symporter